MKIGNMVQWVPHADSPVDAGLGLVVEKRRDTSAPSHAFRIRWHCDIWDGIDGSGIGHWYVYPQDFDDIVVVA